MRFRSLEERRERSIPGTSARVNRSNERLPSVFVSPITFHLSLFTCLPIFLAVLLCLLLAGCPGPKFNPPPSVSPSPTPSPAVTPPPTPTPAPTPLPEAIIPYSHKEVARLFSGVEVHAQVESGIGDIASVERRALDSYLLDLQVHVRVPKAAQTIAELSEPDPSLPTVLPGLAAMLPAGKVSDF